MVSAGKYLMNPGRLPKLVCWAVFIVLLVGYWLFQHDLIINNYKGYSISNVTIVCLLVVVGLLPYSLSHRLKLSDQWYALAFFPSLIIIAIIANDSITLPVIVFTIAMLVLWLLLVVKQPRLEARPQNINLWTIIIAAIAAFICSDTNLHSHYRHRMQSLLAEGQYDKVLQIGVNASETDSAIFNLRATALLQTNQLGNKLFCHPVPGQTIQIQPSTHQVYDTKDLVLCNLLLQKKLTEFARTLPKLYSINSPTLPKHYKEALVIYMSRSANPCISYSDAIVETNYAEFLDEKKKHSTSAESMSKCHDLYGNTYFWYYHFKK